MKRAFHYIWIIGIAIMSILLFLLASASANTNFFDNNYSWLLAVTILVAAGLAALVIWQIARLIIRYKKGIFGTRLMAKLVLFFALMGILPGAVIYGVSVQFMSRSIESWFDVHVESALDSGVKLAQAILENYREDLTIRTTRLANELSEASQAEAHTVLAKLKNDKNGVDAIIVNQQGKLLMASETNTSVIAQQIPAEAMLEQAHDSVYTAIEGGADEFASPEQMQDNQLFVRVIVLMPNTFTSSKQGPYYLQLVQTIPESVVSNAESLRIAYSEYQIRSLSRDGLRKMYIVTLTLTLLLAVFAAVSSAFRIARNLSRPLKFLTKGTKAVAEGNLSPQPEVSSTDELGILTQQFNIMTRQLSEANGIAEKNRAELEAAKTYLESVLTNMSAGVIVLDNNFNLISSNDPVEHILKRNLEQYIGKKISEVVGLTIFSDTIMQAFSQLSAQSVVEDSSRNPYWQLQIDIPRNEQAGFDSDITLLARGSFHLVNHEKRYIVVFDDITDVISAQRSVAWGEVARRLAHEIKNPLTPIQLSAERLQMKLSDKLADNEAAILKRSTETIVKQVTAMKQMVNDFRNFAKTPPAKLVALDLNALIEDIVHLYGADESYNFIHASLEPDLPLIMGDETQLRQVVHNLLQNAQDAVEEVHDRPEYQPEIKLLTEKVHYQDALGKICIAVRMTVMDNGPGFAQNILTRIFEPYITTKERGTGLGMAMVKKIVDEHGGRITIQNRTDQNGAKISIVFIPLASTDDVGSMS